MKMPNIPKKIRMVVLMGAVALIAALSYLCGVIQQEGNAKLLKVPARSKATMSASLFGSAARSWSF
jgi:hypothetical protein